MAWKVLISIEAKLDIQEAIIWYNDRQSGLGNRFHKAVKNTFRQLKKNPYYSFKYQQVRCLKVAKFPFLVHFTLDEVEKEIMVAGVLNTSLDPENNWFLDLT